jgi:glycine cleavage system aminomethyltransferase T
MSQQAQGFVTNHKVGKLRVSGSSAERFIATMTTARMPELAQIGGACAALVLTGQAEVIDTVLVIRTGDQEYMLTTDPGLLAEVNDWLQAHSAIRDSEGPVFEDIELSDETDALGAMALFGVDAPAVMDELVGSPLGEAAGGGHVHLAKVAQVPAMVLSYPLLEVPYYEFYVHPRYLEPLERCLLGFAELDEYTAGELQELRAAHGTWFTNAEEVAYGYPDDLGLMRLVREPMDFVGGKALAERYHGSMR